MKIGSVQGQAHLRKRRIYEARTHYFCRSATRNGIFGLLQHEHYTKRGSHRGDWEEPLPGVWSVVRFFIRLRGLSSAVRLELEAVLLLETNSRATKRCSSNSKKRLTGKVLS